MFTLVRLLRSTLLLSVTLSVLFCRSGLLHTTSVQAMQLEPPPRHANNRIRRVNQHPGTTNWMIPYNKAASTQIQAYTSATSIQAGQKLTFYVSTQVVDTSYSLEVYRLGWYGGQGAELLLTQTNLTGVAQGYYDSVARKLVDCNSCLVDDKTGLIEARWQPSFSFFIPADWTTGVYLAKFTDANGMQTYAPFDVRGSYHADYIIVTPDTTRQAYNRWGGYSLYEADTPLQLNSSTSLSRAVKVSFDRPYIEMQGTGQVLNYELTTIRWLERQGYDLSYISSTDLHRHPEQLLQHKVYLSFGHDEYWSKEMRDGVEHARDQGISLAFLGANASYWQIRFESDSDKQPNRTIVCYKVETADNDLELDPIYGSDNSRLTTRWRDPALGRPENALIGIMFSGYIADRRGYPWQVNPIASSPLLRDTGLQLGQTYGCGLVGYEWDRAFGNGHTPANLQVLSISPTQNTDGNLDYSSTTYYVADSGAKVFATGSIYWTTGLDDYRPYLDTHCVGQALVIPGMQKLLANVMEDLISGKHPAH